MKIKNRAAFTMIELVFVIVVLGILAAIAVPKLAATRDDAEIAKGRSDIASIRSSIISERQGRLLKGQNSYINKLHQGNAGEIATLFDSNGSSTLLMYGIATQETNGHWDPTVTQLSSTNGANVWRYRFHILNGTVFFDYNQSNGTFTCNRNSDTKCQALID